MSKGPLNNLLIIGRAPPNYPSFSGYATTQWFDDCCHLAIRILAYCLAEKAVGQRELMSERIIHERCEKALKQLSKEVDEFQPCEALYTGKSRFSKNKDNEHAIYCYQHKGTHVGGHPTCQSVYGLTPWKQFWGLVFD